MVANAMRGAEGDIEGGIIIESCPFEAFFQEMVITPLLYLKPTLSLFAPIA